MSSRGETGSGLGPVSELLGLSRMPHRVELWRTVKYVGQFKNGECPGRGILKWTQSHSTNLCPVEVDFSMRSEFITIVIELP